jgi:septal ring-binding cell division protein DamX
MIILLIVGAVAFAAWWYWKQLNAEPQPTAVVRPVRKAPVPVPATTSVVAGAPAGPRAGEAPATTHTIAPSSVAPVSAVNKFTIQIELVCQDASLRKAKSIGGDNIWSTPVTYRGQQCYRVFWGRYPTRATAEAAVGEVPAGLRGSKPVAVTIPTP